MAAPLDVVARQNSITTPISSKIAPGASPRVERFFFDGFLNAGGRFVLAAAPRFPPVFLSSVACPAVVFFFVFAVAIAPSH